VTASAPSSADDGSGEALAFDSVEWSPSGKGPCSVLSAPCGSTENSSGAEFEDAREGNAVEEVLSSAEDKSAVLYALGVRGGTPANEILDRI